MAAQRVHQGLDAAPTLQPAPHHQISVKPRLMPKRFSLLLPGLLLSLSASASAETIAVPGNAISFDAPAGFTELTKDQIAQKWVRGTPPSFVVGNAKRTTTIAYNVSNQPVRDGELEVKRQAFEKLFNRVIPGIVWKKKEITAIGGRQWIHLEMTSSAVDTDIYNILLATPLEGKLVLFNFNSTKEDFPRLEASLRKAIGTLAVAKK